MHILIFLICFNLHAKNTFQLSYGSNFNGLKYYRAETNIYTVKKFWQNRKIKANPYVSIGGAVINHENRVVIVSSAYNIRFSISDSKYYNFIDLGIGLTALSDKRLYIRELGSHVLFEDRISIGRKLNNFELSYSFLHYSNGYLASKNHGLNIHCLRLGIVF